MATTYDANIPSASEKLLVMKEIKRSRQLALKFKGFLDRRNGTIQETEEGRCESQFSLRLLRKLDADIEMLRRQLHSDTYAGVRRLAELNCDVANAQQAIEELDGQWEAIEAQVSAERREGDAGAPPSVVARRTQARRRKASAGVRQRLAALRERRDASMAEMAGIEELHRQRAQIAADSRNQLCATFRIEMHIYLDAAKRPGLEPPDIAEELTAEMAIA